MERFSILLTDTGQVIEREPDHYVRDDNLLGRKHRIDARPVFDIPGYHVEEVLGGPHRFVAVKLSSDLVIEAREDSSSAIVSESQ